MIASDELSRVSGRARKGIVIGRRRLVLFVNPVSANGSAHELHQ